MPVEHVSSATAFVVRYLAPAEVDPEARAIIDMLTPIERRVLELLARMPGRERRRQRLMEETNEPWEPARLERVEARALLRVQQQLQQRGLFAG